MGDDIGLGSVTDFLLRSLQHGIQFDNSISIPEALRSWKIAVLLSTAHILRIYYTTPLYT